MNFQPQGRKPSANPSRCRDEKQTPAKQAAQDWLCGGAHSGRLRAGQSDRTAFKVKKMIETTPITLSAEQLAHIQMWVGKFDLDIARAKEKEQTPRAADAATYYAAAAARAEFIFELIGLRKGAE